MGAFGWYVVAAVFVLAWWLTAMRLLDWRFEATRLRNAIREHRAQKADDRCWLDDLDLYRAVGDGNFGDNRVGDRAEMLANCRRFIEARCTGGHWPTYAELEAEVARLRAKVGE